MREFKKREVWLLGGLTVKIESKEDEVEFADALRIIDEKNGPWTIRFLTAWAEGVGKEINARDFGRLVKAEFSPLLTLEDARQRNLALLKRIFDDEVEIERELDRRMSRYIETSEGVIWLGN